MDSPPPRRTAATLIALVVANWALNAACWRFIVLIELEYLFLVAIGVPLAQMFLLAAWLAFADARWPWRIALPVLFTGVAAVEIGTGGYVGTVLPAVLLLLAALFAIVAVLLPLRRIRGWRLTPDEGAAPAEAGQFGIGDLLLWMAVLSVPLALFNFVNAQDWQEDSVPRVMRLLGRNLLLLLLPLHWLAMLAALAPRGLRQSRFYLGGLLLYGAIAIAIALGASRLLSIASSFGMRGGGFGGLMMRVVLAGSPFVISPLVVWLNGRALRSFGWRLVRPAWHSDPASQAAEVQGEVATLRPDSLVQ